MSFPPSNLGIYIWFSNLCLGNSLLWLLLHSGHKLPLHLLQFAIGSLTLSDKFFWQTKHLNWGNSGISSSGFSKKLILAFTGICLGYLLLWVFLHTSHKLPLHLSQ